MYETVNKVPLQELRVCLDPDTLGPCVKCLRRVDVPAQLTPHQHVLFPRRRIVTCEDQIVGGLDGEYPRSE